MSIATKRKMIERETITEYVAPEEGQFVARVVAGRGNNLHDVVDVNDETFLVSMPPKFRRTVWIKRGDYVIYAPIVEGDKVKGEIVQVIQRADIPHMLQLGTFPREFVDSDPLLSAFVKPTDTSNVTSTSAMISSDMLPPSDSDDSEYDTEDGDDDEEETRQNCNPNRTKGVFQ